LQNFEKPETEKKSNNKLEKPNNKPEKPNNKPEKSIGLPFCIQNLNFE
jgi:hypothetical protein